MLGATDVKDCKKCETGYFCPSYPGPPTTKDTLELCGDSYLFCPRGSSKPLHVDLGHYSVTELSNGEAWTDDEHWKDRRTSQILCEPGFYCNYGIKLPCPPGTYGDTSGLFSLDCSGLCPRGFFCPENSSKPLPCSPGSYSTGGARDCTSCEVPHTVPMAKINAMCKDDRSCCFDVYE